tara:strand:+ start:176 stop:892 length:717 start_codon:yes stop_codon:yes gene_type:complete
MKKNILLILISFSFIAFTGCKENLDPEISNVDFITFQSDQVELKVDKGSTNSASYEIYSSNMAAASRTYNVVVSEGTTADPASYTIPASITIPANSNTATLEVAVEDINIISSKILVLSLEQTSGLIIGNDNEFTINLLRICVSSIAGNYTYDNGKPATVTETSSGNYEVSGDNYFGSDYPFNINDACDVISVTGGFLPDAYGIGISGAGMVQSDGSLEITYTVDAYFEERKMILFPN